MLVGFLSRHFKTAVYTNNKLRAKLKNSFILDVFFSILMLIIAVVLCYRYKSHTLTSAVTKESVSQEEGGTCSLKTSPKRAKYG